MIPKLNDIIDRFASAFRIEQDLEENEDTVILHTRSFMGTRLLYEHAMDLTPLIEIAARRAVDAVHAADNADKSIDSPQDPQ